MNNDLLVEPTGAFFFFVLFKDNLSQNCIKLYMDGFYTQRDFHRVQELTNRSSDEKVMAVQSWRLHVNSDIREPRKMRFSCSLNAIQTAPKAQPRPKRLLD